MGIEKLLVPGLEQGLGMQQGPNIPLELLVRMDLVAKFLEILVRTAAGSTVEDAARAIGITFRPPLGEVLRGEFTNPVSP